MQRFQRTKKAMAPRRGVWFSWGNKGLGKGGDAGAAGDDREVSPGVSPPSGRRWMRYARAAGRGAVWLPLAAWRAFAAFVERGKPKTKEEIESWASNGL